MKTHLQQLFKLSSLPKEEAREAMNSLIDEADPCQIAAFLAILKFRGETVDEILGMIEALEKRSKSVQFPFPVLDIVGTGGDLSNSVNISTGGAILAAACGVKIAKHGNRSVSSMCGSADLLQALGCEIEIPPERLLKAIEVMNLAYMFAPFYHPFLKKMGAVRRELKLPTVFNLLGTLLNPAKAEYALIGVANDSALEKVSQVIMRQSYRKKVLIFHGSGLDELSTLGPVHCYTISHGIRTPLLIDPSLLGFNRCFLKDLQGGSSSLNASILYEIFEGQKEGAIFDTLILNAAAALWVYGSVPNLTDGIEIARAVLKEGKALNILQKWRAFSKELQAEVAYEKLKSF